MTEFTDKAAARIGRATLEVERRQRGRRGQRGRWHGDSQRIAAVGRLNAELEQGGTAEVSIWEHTGSVWEDTGEDVEVHDWFLDTGQSLNADDRVAITRIRQGIWVVTAVWCPVS